MVNAKAKPRTKAKAKPKASAKAKAQATLNELAEEQPAPKSSCTAVAEGRQGHGILGWFLWGLVVIAKP
jgi:hypothetical protein